MITASKLRQTAQNLRQGHAFTQASAALLDDAACEIDCLRLALNESERQAVKAPIVDDGQCSQTQRGQTLKAHL